jgi:formylglycine-generating enzyme required for sulfatase activity
VQKLNPTLPPKLASLVMKLLAKKPEHRPESAGAVAQALQALERELSASPVKKPPPVAVLVPPLPARARPDATSATMMIVRPPSLPAPARRRPLLILAILGAIMVLLLAATVRYVQTDTGTRRQEVPVVRPRELPERRPSDPANYLSNSIGRKLAPIPAGEFLMGASAQDVERFKREPAGFNPPEKPYVPQHRVKITKAFDLGACEVTQAQYEKVMGTNPSANKESQDHPVDTVNLDDGVAFCQKLSALPEERQAGRVYRLPTEAEWEYACRAGTTTATHYGNSLSSSQANIDGGYPLGIAEKGPRIGKTVRVASYASNAWGLYDMHGNLWEWCLDGPREYSANAIADPRGPETDGTARVLRGGSWREGAVTAALRKPRDPVRYRTLHVGFRVLLVGPVPGER